MYVLVHKKGNQWFRSDTGALVGTEAPQLYTKYKGILDSIGKRILLKNRLNRDIMIYYGYVSANGDFIHYTTLQQCLGKPCGYYTFVID